jgi:hypothetical protein
MLKLSSFPHTIEMSDSVDFMCLPNGVVFYHGDDANGRLRIFQASGRVYENLPNLRLFREDCVAFAFNDICCDLGRGKVGTLHGILSQIWSTLLIILQVFIFNHMENTDEANIAHMQNVTAYIAFRRLPSLLYMPYVWNEEDKMAWKTMAPSKKFTAILPLKQSIQNEPALEICLQFLDSVNDQICFDGCADAGTTILLAPAPYVGDTKAIRDVLKYSGVVKEERTSIRPIIPTYTGTMQDLGPFLMTPGESKDNGHAIIEWLAAKMSKTKDARTVGDVSRDGAMAVNVADEVGAPWMIPSEQRRLELLSPDTKILFPHLGSRADANRDGNEVRSVDSFNLPAHA